MKKTEAKKAAKETILTAIGTAYYRIADDDSYSEEEKELICEYINKYGTTACKALHSDYITY